MTPNNYVAISDVKAYMPDNEVATTTNWDALVTTLCTNLSRAFDLLTWREPSEFFVSTPQTRYFDGTSPRATDYQTELYIGELAAVPSSISINGNTILSTDYWPKPYNALLQYKPFTSLQINPNGSIKTWGSQIHNITVTGLFGYSAAVPPPVQEALLLYVVRMVRKAQQNYLEVGTFINSGQVLTGMKHDEDLSELILHYKKSII